MRASADGYEHLVRVHAFGFAVLFVNHFSFADLRHLCAENEVYALFLIVFEKYFGNFAVRRPCNVIQHFNNGHLRACRAEIRSHFKPDDTAADDCQPFGDGLHIENFAICHCKAAGNGLAKSLDRGNESVRACADEKSCAFIRLARRFNRKALRVSPFYNTEFGYDVGSRAFELHCYAARQLFYDLVFSSDDECVVKGGALALYAVCVAVLCVIEYFCTVKKGFCRHAAFV